jgi:hypothetical protein
MILSAREEMIAVKLNRLFAAARSLRGRNPAGYDHSCKELQMLKEQLESGDNDLMQRILDRVNELSNGTFYWDP